ncbi:MAG: transporter, partial [Desulfobacteraceae bacterium]|nr:transporter [Desulfobacteraceae bacterium]
DQLGAFVEAYGSIAMNPSNTPSNAVDGGFTYLILENFQVDISGGKGISEAATDWYVGAGFTYRYPR